MTSKQLLATFLFSLMLLTALILPACSNVKTGVSSGDSNPVVNGKKLDKSMSDAQILEVFGIEISKAEVRRTQGKDGYSMTYKLGEQEVSITHSVVSGVAINARGPIKGFWSLGGGNS